jgi:hypothetical protein
MEDQTNRELGPGWDRQQLSLRLTPERKAELLALRAGIGPGSTPTDAIDRALDIVKQIKWRERLGGVATEDIEDAIESQAAGIRETIERQGREIEQINKSLFGLRRLMSTIADAPDSDGDLLVDARPQGPVSLRAWLEEATLKAGAKAKRSVIARSLWQRKTSSAPRMVALDLMIELVAIDGALVSNTAGYPEYARIDLIDAEHPICGLELPRPMFLVCQALANGWIAHARHATADGQPGEAIGSHRI